MLDKEKKNNPNNMPVIMRCPCGGGKLCIVEKRWIGKLLIEDLIFKRINLPIRNSCYQSYTYEQLKALYLK
tara:strand:- start:368 stop:580 length:213 start_codon:yes stop_codon:yes gene_type:complete